MTEYIIITALVAIAGIGIITIFGDNIRALFGAAAQALAGKSVSNPADGQDHEQARKKTLKSFGQNN
jgi:Flp pilus assembly pilin Flp